MPVVFTRLALSSWAGMSLLTTRTPQQTSRTQRGRSNNIGFSNAERGLGHRCCFFLTIWGSAILVSRDIPHAWVKHMPCGQQSPGWNDRFAQLSEFVDVAAHVGQMSSRCQSTARVGLSTVSARSFAHFPGSDSREPHVHVRAEYDQCWTIVGPKIPRVRTNFVPTTQTVVVGARLAQIASTLVEIGRTFVNRKATWATRKRSGVGLGVRQCWPFRARQVRIGLGVSQRVRQVLSGMQYLGNFVFRCSRSFQVHPGLCVDKRLSEFSHPSTAYQAVSCTTQNTCDVCTNSEGGTPRHRKLHHGVQHVQQPALEVPSEIGLECAQGGDTTQNPQGCPLSGQMNGLLAPKFERGDLCVYLLFLNCVRPAEAHARF